MCCCMCCLPTGTTEIMTGLLVENLGRLSGVALMLTLALQGCQQAHSISPEYVTLQNIAC